MFFLVLVMVFPPKLVGFHDGYIGYLVVWMVGMVSGCFWYAISPFPERGLNWGQILASGHQEQRNEGL